MYLLSSVQWILSVLSFNLPAFWTQIQSPRSHPAQKQFQSKFFQKKTEDGTWHPESLRWRARSGLITRNATAAVFPIRGMKTICHMCRVFSLLSALLIEALFWCWWGISLREPCTASICFLLWWQLCGVDWVGAIGKLALNSRRCCLNMNTASTLKRGIDFQAYLSEPAVLVRVDLKRPLPSVMIMLGWFPNQKKRRVLTCWDSLSQNVTSNSNADYQLILPTLGSKSLMHWRIAV